MQSKLEQIEYRQSLIGYINGQENIDRKSRSLADCDVYSGDIEPYVLKKFTDKYKPQTVAEIPICSTVNIAKKVVDCTATIYKEAPERIFHDVSDKQKEILTMAYNDMWFDTRMLSANRFFKLQGQTHVMVIPKNGKLYARVIKAHQLDVVPVAEDPEEGEIYILTGFDQSLSTLKTQTSDGINEPIADEDDYKALTTRHVVWSKDYHFVMNGRGEILTGKDMENPIGMIPIVDISDDKDLEYFIQYVNNDTKFTVEFNEMLSNQNLVVAMQGFSQAVMMAPEELMPESITVGPTKILKIITNENIAGETDFKFVNPGSDLAGVQANTLSLLALFLSSKGLDPSTITGAASGGSSYTSGIERLLALMEKFEASKDDISRFEQAERMIYKIVKAWLSNAGEELLPKYHAGVIPEDSEVTVKFAEPTGIKTEKEILEMGEQKIDMGIADKVSILAELEDITEDQAKERLDAIAKRAKVYKEGSLPEVEPEGFVREGSQE